MVAWEKLKNAKLIPTEMGLVNGALRHVIYVRRALGQFGVPISVYKLRTMRHGALEDHISIYSGELDWTGRPAIDPRITFLGRFLRRHFIDELPQLANLANGTMSIVGIRPRSEEEWSIYPRSLQDEALKLRPGLLGVVYAHRNLKGFDSHVRVQYEYLERRAKNAAATDREYIERIIGNIVFRGLRSR